MKRLLLAFFAISLFLSACNTDSSSNAEETQTTQQHEETGKKYTLTAFTPSTSFPDAKMESVDYQEGTFNYVIGGEGYELGIQTPDADQKMCANSGQGQHIHLIVDTLPYAAKYEASFDHQVADDRVIETKSAV